MSSENKIEPQLIEQIIDCSIVCILDENFSIYYSNNNFCSLIGFTEDDLIKKNLLNIKHHDQSNAIYDFLIKTLERGEPWKGELQLHHKNEYPIWLDTTITPALSDTQPNRYIVTFLDISQRKQLIENLKHRAHRQSLIAILGQISLNNIPIIELLEQTLSVVCGSLNIDSGAILELSVNGENALVRASYNSKYLTPEKTTIKVAQNNLLGYSLNCDRPVVCESLSNEQRFNIPQELLKENAESTICTLIGEKKYPFGIFCLFSTSTHDLNIDEIHFLQSISNILAEAINRKNMEKALRQERELSKKYLDVAEVLIIVIDKNEKIILANNHAASILECSKNDLAGTNFIETFIPSGLKNSVRENFKNLLKGKNVNENLVDVRGNVTPVINKKNKTCFIKWKSSFLYDDDGNIDAILSAGEDITELLEHEEEQRKLEKQLHQAQKLEAIGMLAGGIAHDFNNILASILGFSELAIENIDPDNTKLIQYLTQIQTSGIKARDIIAQMQSINLQDEAPNKAILLPSLLKGTLKMLRSALPSSINMRLNINNDVPAVYINASKFNQMVMHLLTNARNALNGKGNIEIELSVKSISNISCSICNEKLDNDYAVLSIRDDGPGIKNEVVLDLYKDNSYSQDNSGLPFITRLVHDNNGHILISSQHTDENFKQPGTEIQLLFSISKDTSETSFPDKQSIDFSSIDKKHIMIVDDENSVASYMGELFRGAGFKATVFCDPVEALNSFKHKPDSYDLIVTDQTMPLLTGDVLATQMLEIRTEIPIIICTGHSNILDKDKAEDLHIKGFLNKPVDSAELLHMVVTLLTENTQ